MRIEKLIKKHEIRINSKDVKKNDIFVCALGTDDKNKYIRDALDRGASMIFTDKDYQDKRVFKCQNVIEY